MDTARKTVFLTLWLLLFSAFCQAAQEENITHPGTSILWTTQEPGMDSAILAYTVQKSDGYTRRIHIHTLRMDTKLFDFRLFSTRWEDGRARTIRQWTEEKSLTAAINACMYQTDGLSSTGYMRQGERTNNKRVVKAYGSFFVCGPRQSGLPQAAVLDRSTDDWRTLLPLYDTVVQNFRLMGPEGEQLWPENGPRHAIAAVAQDKDGRILFLICPEPASVREFVDALNAHKNLALHSAMYVEGGSDASLMLASNGASRLLTGLSPAGYMLSSRGDDIPLPNILGAVRRQNIPAQGGRP